MSLSLKSVQSEDPGQVRVIDRSLGRSPDSRRRLAAALPVADRTANSSPDAVQLGQPAAVVPVQPIMANKMGYLPPSFRDATRSTTRWVHKVGTSTGKGVAAWSAAVIWLVLLYSFLICWHVMRAVFFCLITLPIQVIHGSRHKDPEIQQAQLTTMQNEQETTRAGRTAADMSPDAVQLAAVSKSYARRRHRHEAVHSLTASFPKGTLTAVMGVSGSGKSTLLQCAAGLDRPSAGSVHIGGVDVTRLGRKKLSVLRRERVGFVFQALNLVPTLTVADNIALPLRLDGRHVSRGRVEEVASLVGIADKLRRLPDTLSGGQQQRVAIARALITEPDVIFADEPTAALDPYTTEAVLGLLRQAVDELHQTVVLVTHQPSVAALADRVLLLDGGRVVGLRESPDPAELESDLRQLGAGATS